MPLCLGLQAKAQESLFVCYGRVAPEHIQGFDMVILEPGHYKEEEIALFKKNNEKVIGYVSCTEVNLEAPYYEEVSDFVLGANDNWDSHYLDVSMEECRSVLLQYFHSVLAKGFDGLFLDTLDNASQWGPLFRIQSGLFDLIRATTQLKNDIILLQNGGLWNMEFFGPLTRGVLVESVVTAFDFQKGTYELASKEQAIKQIKRLKAVKKKFKKEIYIVEYTQSARVKTMVERIIPKDFNVFVANIDLNQNPKFE
ncbi:endo alpha-1,4 polygalactosaminidase [Sediminicola luteus]|nr:endo alpha-1,4 polygalactosaminidase [Sediminicola luteus]